MNQPARCNTSSATQKSLSTPSTAIIFQLEASAGAAGNEAAVKKENNKKCELVIVEFCHLSRYGFKNRELEITQFKEANLTKSKLTIKFNSN